LAQQAEEIIILPACALDLDPHRFLGVDSVDAFGELWWATRLPETPESAVFFESDVPEGLCRAGVDSVDASCGPL
jgi:hypothetical protein